MFYFILFNASIYSLSCNSLDINEYLTNKHILKGKVVNRIEFDKGDFIEEYFLIEPILFFTKETKDKLIVHNIVSKELLNSNKVYSVNSDLILNMSKEYYFFVDKNTNIVKYDPCEITINETDGLVLNSLAYKLLSLFNSHMI